MNFAALPHMALSHLGLDWRIGATNPSVDLYFSGALGDLIAAGPGPRAARPIRQIGPHLFVCGDTAVIVRYAQPREIEFIRQRRFTRVYYVLDDLLLGIEGDQSLPAGYRHRLAAFASGRLPRILDLATTVVVPNAAVASGLRDRHIEILQPAGVSVCQDFSHFDYPAWKPINLLLSGSRSHAADIEMIAPAVAKAARKNPRLRVTSFLGDHAPRVLRALPDARHRPQMPWLQFRRILQNVRFHIACAPYRDTPFNGARSFNKILDHGAFGAAGLYSNREPHSQYIDHERTGFLLRDDEQDWTEGILSLADRLSHAADFARNGARLARKLGDRRRVRRFWTERLGIAST